MATKSGDITGEGRSGERLQEAASSVAQEAGRTAEMQASKTMDQVGQALEQIAQAVREGGQKLREQRPEFGGVADTAATQIESAAQYVRQHEPRDVLDRVQEVAQRQPAVVIAGGLAAGLFIGRFLRSASSPSWDSGPRYGDWRSGSGNGAGLSGRYGYDTYDMPGSGYGTGYGAGYGQRVGYDTASGRTGGGGVGQATRDSTGTSSVAGSRVVDEGSAIDTGVEGSTSGSTMSGSTTTGSTVGSTSSGTGRRTRRSSASEGG
ncbi:MAG: hypothetical protein ACJ761_07005 [Chloroflexota bacterium]